MTKAHIQNENLSIKHIDKDFEIHLTSNIGKV